MADLEQAKTVRELEIQELERRLEHSLALKDVEISKHLEIENELNKKIETLESEKEELGERVHQMQQGTFILTLRWKSSLIILILQ